MLLKEMYFLYLNFFFFSPSRLLQKQNTREQVNTNAYDDSKENINKKFAREMITEYSIGVAIVSSFYNNDKVQKS